MATTEHANPTREQGGFVPACALTDVPETGAIGLEVEGVPLAVVRSGGEVYAIHNICSHEHVELSEGDVDDDEIECWLHGSRFDLRTGDPTGLPATQPVPVYACRVENDTVLVDVHQQLNDAKPAEH